MRDIMPAMDDAQSAEIAGWLTEAGLAGTPETALLDGFCERCVAAGVPLGRAHLLIDTLHPVHEGRIVRWGYGAAEPALLDYGRTSPVDTLGGARGDAAEIAKQAEAAERWLRSPFHHMLQTARRCCGGG